MVKKPNLRIAIISIFSFPIGLAATNRIIAYSKGLIENGCSVDIYIPEPSDRPDLINLYGNSGEYQGINYYYTTGRFRNKYKIIRALSILTFYRKISGFCSTRKLITKENKVSQYHSVIISNDMLSYLFYFCFLAKKIDAKSVFIFDEYPVPIRHKLKNNIPNWKKQLYKHALRHVNAYISISDALSTYYNSFAVHKTFILPVILDTSRFNKIKLKEAPNSKKYLCYMGNMELSKDNVDIIINAFSILSKEYPDLILNLFGNPSISDLNNLKSLIEKLQLKRRVFIMGKINSENVAEILANAYILVSSQPETLRASGGFPTKLGEYLASGTPALITNVGENARYVNDKEHIFFVKPNDFNDYANKLRFIIDNYEFAKMVALKGKQFVNEKYSHKTMGAKLKEFLISI
ncbi:MAG: glycosyltransferase family 4 protein [Paludibacter sp.]